MVVFEKGALAVPPLASGFWRDNGQVLLFFGAGDARDKSLGRAKGKWNPL